MNKLPEVKNTEAAAHRCSEAVLKNQKPPLADVLQDICFQKFSNIHRKTSELGSVS